MFHRVLERLDKAAYGGRQRGVAKGYCYVNCEDLGQLLHHFRRIETELHDAKPKPAIGLPAVGEILEESQRYPAADNYGRSVEKQGG